MQKLGLLGMKSFDQFKLLTGASSGTAKTLSISSRSSSGAITSGSFDNLKLTAEKLVKEQASVRTDLDLANSKLKKSLEQIHVLEEKLQTAFNENAKLKVKQKLWLGLESKLSSTKTLCDQLTETLQVLACQVQDAEKDKLVIEEKLNTNSAALDSLNDEMKSLSLKLECAEETVRERDEALKEVTVQKQEQEAAFEGEKFKSIRFMEEKDALIKSLEEDVTTTRLAGESLKSKLDDACMELKLKEEDLSQMRFSLENLEGEKIDLQFSNDEFAKKLAASLQETQNLKEVVNAFAAKLSELDQQSLAVSDKISQLCLVYDSCSKIAEQEKHLIVKNQHLLLCTLLIYNVMAMEALPIFLDSLLPAWVSILVSVTLILAFGEIIPQAVCSQYGLSIGAKVAVLVRLLVVILLPISYPISKLLDWLLGKRHSALLRRSELKAFVDLHANEAGKGGELTHDETTIIGGALELSEKTAEDAMTPYKPQDSQYKPQDSQNKVWDSHNKKKDQNTCCQLCNMTEFHNITF